MRPDASGSTIGPQLDIISCFDGEPARCHPPKVMSWSAPTLLTALYHQLHSCHSYCSRSPSPLSTLLFRRLLNAPFPSSLAADFFQQATTLRDSHFSCQTAPHPPRLSNTGTHVLFVFLLPSSAFTSFVLFAITLPHSPHYFFDAFFMHPFLPHWQLPCSSKR